MIKVLRELELKETNLNQLLEEDDAKEQRDGGDPDKSMSEFDDSFMMILGKIMMDNSEMSFLLAGIVGFLLGVTIRI